MLVRATFLFYPALALLAQTRSTDFAAGMRAYQEGNFAQALTLLAADAQKGNPTALNNNLKIYYPWFFITCKHLTSVTLMIFFGIRI